MAEEKVQLALSVGEECVREGLSNVSQNFVGRLVSILEWPVGLVRPFLTEFEVGEQIEFEFWRADLEI